MKKAGEWGVNEGKRCGEVWDWNLFYQKGKIARGGTRLV